MVRAEIDRAGATSVDSVPLVMARLAEIDRIAESIRRYGDRFVGRVFTEGEIAYCRRKRDFAPSFAARFGMSAP